MTHLRRAGTAVGHKVLFTEYTPFKSNTCNILAEKESIILILVQAIFQSFSMTTLNIFQICISRIKKNNKCQSVSTVPTFYPKRVKNRCKKQCPYWCTVTLLACYRHLNKKLQSKQDLLTKAVILGNNVWTCKCFFTHAGKLPTLTYWLVAIL